MFIRVFSKTIKKCIIWEKLKKSALINIGFCPNPYTFIYIWTKFIRFSSKSMIFYRIWTKIVSCFES